MPTQDKPRAGERTQLSNPRTSQGRPLRCPDCGVYAHAQNTKCEAELAARKASEPPTQAHTRWIVDDCPDANGHFTIRLYDGSLNGNTDAQPIATVYTEADSDLIAAAPATKAQRDELLEALRAIANRTRPCHQINECVNWDIRTARAAIARAEAPKL